MCEPVDLDPRRSIFETNVEVLEPFSMRAILRHAAKNAGYKATPDETYERLIDTYATGANARFADGQHCDDELPDPRFSNADEMPCGLLGCDQVFFCMAHDTDCFACRSDGSACEVVNGIPDGEHEVCRFDSDVQLCTFDGRRISDCAPVVGDECDGAGCDPLGCEAVQMCDPTFELCITCTAELDECRIDSGTPDEAIEPMCNGVDMCELDVAAGIVSGCEPDPICEEAQCGPLGCNSQFVCTTDFQFCFECSEDGQVCELFGQEVPSPSAVCNFSNEQLCTFTDGTVGGCGPDEEEICFGGGGTEDTGDPTDATATDPSGGFIVTGDEFGDEEVGDDEVGGGFISGGESEVGGEEVSGGFIISGGESEGGESEGGESEGGDDFGGDGFGAIDGYPLECPRFEAEQIDNIDAWFPISISNRFDLAPADGANCGQQRIVLANNAQGRMFTIFEAQIPNPHPECGLAACRPIVEFWAGLNEVENPRKRRKQLVKAFFTGHPALLAAGFGPFVNADHYTFGTGQVRTNNFDDSPWTLREFKLVEHPNVNPAKPSKVHVTQIPVTYSPNGDHWNDALDTPHGPECRESFLVAMEGLLVDEPNAMHFVIDDVCKAAESRDDFVSDFAQQMVLGTGAFEAAIETRLAELGSPLTPIDIANRARFAGACIGCHEQSNGADLGNGITAPFSAGFTHTMEFAQESCGEDQQCFAISDALSESFLPHRKQVMEDFLAANPCDAASCGVSYALAPSGPVDVLGALVPGRRIDVRLMLELERRMRERGAKVTVGGGSTIATH